MPRQAFNELDTNAGTSEQGGGEQKKPDELRHLLQQKEKRTNRFADVAAEMRNCTQRKIFAPQTTQFARKQKFQKMETL